VKQAEQEVQQEEQQRVKRSETEPKGAATGCPRATYQVHVVHSVVLPPRTASRLLAKVDGGIHKPASPIISWCSLWAAIGAWPAVVLCLVLFCFVSSVLYVFSFLKNVGLSGLIRGDAERWRALFEVVRSGGTP
jgi:hypothetical protein